MNFFQNSNDKFTNHQGQQNKQIDERDAIKSSLSVNLTNIGFSKEEVDSVIIIITNAEQEIEVLKRQLDNIKDSDIEVDKLHTILPEIFEKIRIIQEKSASDVKDKIAEIRLKKQK